MASMPKLENSVDIKKLLEAGAHFGHVSSRWHPKMGQYIHSKRSGSHIIDLNRTVEGLESALEFLTSMAKAGKQVLLVGTKRQAKDLIKQTALDLGMPYVSERWLGGMLTNQNTISTQIKRLKDLETKMESGELASKYSKLEILRYQEEIDRMNFMYGGIKDMVARPGALFVVDVPNELNAIREARKLHIPIVALVDTNADPTLIDYVIPCNDDAIKTIQLVLDYVSQAIRTGKGKSDEKRADSTQPTVDSKEGGAVDSTQPTVDTPKVVAKEPAAKPTKEPKLKPKTSNL